MVPDIEVDIELSTPGANSDRMKTYIDGKLMLSLEIHNTPNRVGEQGNLNWCYESDSGYLKYHHEAK